MSDYAICYNYNPSTGAYTGTGYAYADPLGDGYLLPASATLIAPPATTGHQVAYFSGDPATGSWTIVNWEARYTADNSGGVVDWVRMDTYVPVAGEFLFENAPTAEEIEAVVPGYIATMTALNAGHTDWYVFDSDHFEPVTETIAAYQVAQSHISADAALSAYTNYPVTEVDGWDRLLSEAEKVQADGSYSSTLLNAVVSASNGAWTLESFITTVITKAAAYDVVLGEAIGKRAAIEAGIAEIVAGIAASPPTHTVDDLLSYNIVVTV